MRNEKTPPWGGWGFINPRSEDYEGRAREIGEKFSSAPRGASHSVTSRSDQERLPLTEHHDPQKRQLLIGRTRRPGHRASRVCLEVRVVRVVHECFKTSDEHGSFGSRFKSVPATPLGSVQSSVKRLTKFIYLRPFGRLEKSRISDCLIELKMLWRGAKISL